jgi:hypothetical protein
MGFLLASDRFSYGQRSKCADLLNSYLLSRLIYTSLKSPSMTSSFAEEELPAALPVPA